LELTERLKDLLQKPTALSAMLARIAPVKVGTRLDINQDSEINFAVAGLSNVTGPIKAGHFSQGGSATAEPMDDDKTTFGQCPKGFYCPEGSENPTPCPAGTYSNSWRVTALANCLPCAGGFYCPEQNMTAIGPECLAGYYCSGGSPVSDPVGQVYGDECPTGYFCVLGSSQPASCAAGTYQNETRKASCRACPAGFYCPINTTTPESCPSGYYCLASTRTAFTYPCPKGKYNNLTERYSDAACQNCPSG
jgi:hypothetical protein